MDGKRKRKLPKELRKKSGVDDLTEAGTLLGAVGGTVIGSSALTAWVHVGGRELSVFDMVDADRLYLLILIAQLLALVCAMISAIMLRSSNWSRERKIPWAMPLVAFNIVMIVFIAVAFVLMEGDYLSVDETSSYGPGPFLAVFGLMFSWVGALMFVLDAREHAGDHHSSRTEGRQRYPKPERPGRRVFVEPTYVECHNCGEDVPDDSPICPRCRAVITGEGQDGYQEEEDLEEVR
ncbi:MAG: hypothetical protein LLG16_08380 [Euryarchaeota archaeon]|nr:hypothetical protein [Euryarchaeota archaeon]